MGVQVAGFPAEVKTIFTPSRIMISICWSTREYNKGMFTPNGLPVAALHFLICSSSTSGSIDPAPSNPNPPALLTAEASRHPLHQIIPAWIMGKSIPNNVVIRLIKWECFIKSKCKVQSANVKIQGTQA
jgi:hypothetical protein